MLGTSSTNSGTQTLTLDTDNSVEWVKRECADCGEEFATLRILTDTGRDLCPECSPPPAGLFENKPSVVGAPFPDRPLMEFGPLSHGRRA